MKIISQAIKRLSKAEEASAHCDGPCGIYDPSSARIAAEAVLSLTKKILALEVPSQSDTDAYRKYLSTFTRYTMIKEEEAQKAKDELLILWTDYFKPPHLETFPDLHEIFWNAAKTCSYAKTELSLQHAEELLAAVKNIHGIFWKSKGRDVAWETAG